MHTIVGSGRQTMPVVSLACGKSEMRHVVIFVCKRADHIDTA